MIIIIKNQLTQCKGTPIWNHAIKPSNGNHQHRKKKPMQAYETMRWKPVCGNQHNSVKKKLPLLVAVAQQPIHCLTKSTAFCSPMRASGTIM